MNSRSKSIALCMAAALVAGTGCDDRFEKSTWNVVSFSPNDKQFVACGGKWMKSGSLKVWNCSTWQADVEWKGEIAGEIQGARFASDDVLVTVNGKCMPEDARRYSGNELQFWNISEKKHLETIDLKNAQGFADCIDYFPKGKIVVFNQWKKSTGTGGIYTIPELEKQTEFGNDFEFNTRYMFAPDGRMVLALGKNVLRMFDTATGKPIAQVELEGANERSSLQRASFSPDGSGVAVSLADPDRVYLVSSDLKRTTAMIDRKLPSPFVAFSPDSKSLAILNESNDTELVFIETKAISKVFKGDKGHYQCCCFSNDGKMIAVAGDNGVRVHDVETGKVVAELK